MENAGNGKEKRRAPTFSLFLYRGETEQE